MLRSDEYPDGGGVTTLTRVRCRSGVEVSGDRMPIVGHCPPTGTAGRYSVVEASSLVCSVLELFNSEHSFSPPVDSDLDVAIALNMRQQRDVLRLRSSYQLRSCQANFGTPRAMLLD